MNNHSRRDAENSEKDTMGPLCLSGEAVRSLPGRGPRGDEFPALTGGAR